MKRLLTIIALLATWTGGAWATEYEAPEILENGDILIRRKRAEPAEDDAGQDI